jgi:hypothetical protein
MGKDRREKDRESRRDRDTRNSDDEKEKKKKDRGKEKERNRSRERGRDRSRDRDNEKTKEKRREDRDKRRKRSRDRENKKDRPQDSSGHNRRHHQARGRSSSLSDEEQTSATKKSKTVDESVPEEAPGATKTSGEISLNIEETNKLRASLGLKPLQVDEQGDNKTSSQLTEEVHAPPSNLGTLQAAEKLREKMETIRVKREQHKRLRCLSIIASILLCTFDIVCTVQ